MLRGMENGKCYRVSICLATPLLGVPSKVLKKVFKQTHRCVQELATRAKRQRQPKCPSTDESINRMWSSHTRDYHLVVRRNQGSSEHTMLRERSPTPCMAPLIGNVQNRQIHRERAVVARGWKEG